MYIVGEATACTAGAAPGAGPARLQHPRPQAAGRAQLRDGRELLGGDGDPQLQQAGGGVDVEPGGGERAQVGDAGGETGSRAPGRPTRPRRAPAGRRRPRRAPAGSPGTRGGRAGRRTRRPGPIRSGPGRPTGSRPSVPSSAAGPTRAAPSSRYASAAASASGRGRGGVEDHRGEVEEHAVEGRRQVGDRGARPSPTASQIDVAPFARSARTRLARVGVGVPGPHVPPVGDRPARPGAADERPHSGHPGVRELDDVVGGVERADRDPVRGGPGQGLDSGTGRRGVVEPAGPAQDLVDRRDPRRAVGRRSVDEREVLRLVGCVAVQGPRCRPSWCSCASTPAARPAAGAGPAGGRRPRLAGGAVGGVYAGGGITGAGRDPCHTRRPGRPADTREAGLVPRSRPWHEPGLRGRTARSGEEDRVAVHADRLRRQRRLCGAGGHRAVRDRELAAVARADDHAVGHRLDLAALVGAGRRERLEVARRRLGDDHVLVGEDGAAADRDARRWWSARSAPAEAPADEAAGARREPDGAGRGRGARAPSRSTRRHRRSAARRRRPRRRRRRPRAGSGRARPAAGRGRPRRVVGRRCVMEFLAWWERCTVRDTAHSPARFTGALG